MIETAVLELDRQLEKMLAYMVKEQPLIHCITNPISINDCANVLLAIGARPIMAEHPNEAAEITAMAKGLALNLGNITDARMESMVLSGRAAKEKGIPLVIDMVGVACSTLRREYAQRLLQATAPSIIKGNISELRALLGLPVTEGMGVEAGQKEMVTAENAGEYARLFQKIAREKNTVLLATGAMDLIVASETAYTISNGTFALAGITGTGCMVNVLCGACLAAAKNLQLTEIAAGILACLLLEIAAEECHELYVQQGPGSFHSRLLDEVHGITAQEIQTRRKVKKL